MAIEKDIHIELNLEPLFPITIDPELMTKSYFKPCRKCIRGASGGHC